MNQPITRTSRTLKLSTLKANGACGSSLAAFKKNFGDSVEVTEALCIAHAKDFDWGWAALKLLKAPALAEYWRVKAPALAEYWRVKAQALAEYERVTAPAWAEYERVKAQAWAEYERVTAPAWARLYINDVEAA